MDDAARGDDRPLALVHGNCQADALRALLAASPGFGWQVVQVPPVFLLEAADLPAYDALLGRATLLLAQPVRDGYRGLPLGTAEAAGRLAPGGRVLRWPVVRWQGLQPYAAIVRAADGAEPTVVPYHDLRTLTGRAPRSPDLVAAWQHSLAELARREARDTDVAVSDLLVELGAAAVHTLNHPANALLVELARRVQAALDQPVDATAPARELLGAVRAPVEPAALQALGADPAAARPDWLVDGTPVAAADVTAAHAAFYAARSDVVAAGTSRHAERLGLLGLAA